ncbi:hypothetical protein IBB72_13790, partial [Listeria seeligeri]|nr:hypothetical protein [Listeria seeligeri]
PPRERLAFAGVGDDISGQTATGTISAAQKKLRDMMSKMDDLNIKGSGTGDIIGGASGLNKIDNIDVIDGRVGGKIPVDDFQKMRQSSLHNTNADSMTLGKYTPTIENGVPNWSKAGPDSYIGKAGKDSMYFDLGDDWASIQKQYNLSDTEMFEYLNKPALDDAISSGKEIKFSHNPLDYDNGFIVDEWEYIKETLNVTDDNLVKNGDFWYVKQ